MPQLSSTAKRHELLRLMHYDFTRFFKSTPFRVCIIVFVLITLFTSVVEFLVYTFKDDFIVFINFLYPEDIASEIAIEKTTVSELMINFAACGLPLIMATIAATCFLTAEFTSSTIHNLSAMGFGRIHIYLSKLITVFCCMLVMVMPLGVLNFGINVAFFGFDTTDMETLRTVEFLLMNVLSYFTYSAVFTALAMIIRSGAAVMTVNLLIEIASSIVFMLLDIPLGAIGISISRFWLVNFTGSMIYYSFYEPALVICAVGAACYAVLATVIGIIVFCKADIK